MSIRSERLATLFVREVSKILAEEIKDETIKFVTITGADVTRDLSLAKIYFTVLDDNKKEVITNSLEKASRFVRKELCGRVQLRKMPEVKFVYDESIAYGNKIERIIEKIKED
ncbi:MAG: 30S ribosome-binding factor RbfA [Bacilli bacterium]|jgi:ribosome-binding factor A|nr:30S ribosome-binding factor RbfA [Bacilli bacterium]